MEHWLEEVGTQNYLKSGKVFKKVVSYSMN